MACGWVSFLCHVLFENYLWVVHKTWKSDNDGGSYLHRFVFVVHVVSISWLKYFRLTTADFKYRSLYRWVCLRGSTKKNTSEQQRSWKSKGPIPLEPRDPSPLTFLKKERRFVICWNLKFHAHVGVVMTSTCETEVLTLNCFCKL